MERRVTKLVGVNRWRVEGFFVTRYNGLVAAGWKHVKTWTLGSWDDCPGWELVVYGLQNDACQALQRSIDREALELGVANDTWLPVNCVGDTNK